MKCKKTFPLKKIAPARVKPLGPTLKKQVKRAGINKL
jgi:hypothetical protein